VRGQARVRRQLGLTPPIVPFGKARREAGLSRR